MRKLFAAVLTLLTPLVVFADDAPKTAPPGTPVTITVTQVQPATPTVTITLGSRHAQAVPCKGSCDRSGGGNIDVQTPTADTVVITLSGAAVAWCGNAGFDFNVEQCFEVVFEKPEVKAAKVTMEARVIGVLRSQCKHGCANVGEGHASLVCGAAPTALLSIATPAHGVCSGENLSINDHEGPCSTPIVAGKYQLHICWHLDASRHGYLPGPCHAPSADFSPDGAVPVIDPLWISYKEPFHGITKKDFGLQITLKVAEETVPANGDKTNGDKTNGDKKEDMKEKLPPPMEPMKEKLPPPPPAPEKKVSWWYR